MDGDAEALPHRLRPPGGRSRRIPGALLLDEVEDLVRALVRALGPARAGEQPRQPGRGEGRRRGIEGLPAHPKGGRHLGDRPLVDAMATEHLVLHLHAIASIEELVAPEGLVLDGFRARMERAGGAERGDLGIFRLGRASSSHRRVKNTTSIQWGHVKDILPHVVAMSNEHGSGRGPRPRDAVARLDEILMTHGTKFR